MEKKKERANGMGRVNMIRKAYERVQARKAREVFEADGWGFALGKIDEIDELSALLNRKPTKE